MEKDYGVIYMDGLRRDHRSLINRVSSLDKNPSNNSNLCRFDQSKRKSPCGERSYAHAGKIKLSKFKVEKKFDRSRLGFVQSK
jgi:hypothetical protein